MRVLVVDDEPLARRRLVRMLSRIDGVSVAGEAVDGIEALEQIRADRPDAVLLDIRMPGLDGLTLARSSPDLPPIIFTTAFDEHAVAAFEAEAVDYLLKPIPQERLEQALQRVRSTQPSVSETKLAALLSRVAMPDPIRITARSGDVIRVFDPADISRFRASDKYTAFHADGTEFLLDESLSQLETRLAPLHFVRVHRSELVHLGRIRALHQVDGGVEVEMVDGDRVPVSRRLVAELKRRLGMA